MSTTLCSECLNPLSLRPEKADRRVQTGPDQWAHRYCVNISPEAAIVQDIFGGAPYQQRQVNTARYLGEALGHHTETVLDAAGFHWVCQCGMTGHADPRNDRSVQKEAALQHQRDEAVYR